MENFDLPVFNQRHIMVQSYDADSNCFLTLPQLLAFLQDIAWEHTEKVKFGFEYMASMNLIWALSRLEIQIERLPKWQEFITIRTWSKGHDAIIADRDYEILDESGQCIIRGTAMWVIMDMNTRRVQRIGNVFKDFPQANRAAIDHRVDKIADLREDESLLTTPVQKIVWSDTDMNGHVNNASYLRWVLDELATDEISSIKPRRLRINFNSESRAGEHRFVRLTKTEKELSAHIFRQEDAKELVRIHLECS